MNAYETHTPILKTIFKAVEIGEVLEFGPGAYSTEYFISKVKSLISIEQQSDSYHSMCCRRHEETKNVKFLKLIGPVSGVNWLKAYEGRFDLILVDGHGEGRPEAINAAFKKTAIIVAHDTEHPRYGWERVRMPKGWTRIDSKAFRPWTTTWTKNKKVEQALHKKQEVE